MRRSDFSHLRQDSPAVVGEVLLCATCSLAAHPFSVLHVLAGEESACERAVGDDAESVLGADTREFGFVLFAVDEAVVRLERRVGRESVFRCDFERFAEQVGPVVRGPDVADLSRLHQFFEGAQGFFDRDVFIEPVRLVEVDCFDLQPAQGVLAGPDDVRAAEPVAVIALPHSSA